MKKRLMGIICALLGFIMLFSFAGCGEKSHAQLIKEAFKEAERINAASSFGKEGLFLSRAGEDELNNITGPMDDYSSYYISKFADGIYRNAIVIRSEGFDVFGIGLGDSLEKSEKMLMDQGYTYQGDLNIGPKYTYGGRCYVKGYVTIELKCLSPDDADIITGISVKALDPEILYFNNNQ